MYVFHVVWKGDSTPDIQRIAKTVGSWSLQIKIIVTSSRTQTKTFSGCKIGAQLLWNSSKKAFMH